MLLVANIGNSDITFGVFKSNDCNLLSSFKISSDVKRTTDEYLVILDSISTAKGINKNDISGSILSSVVPQLTSKIKTVISAFCGVEPLTVGPGVKTGFHIKIDSPAELGGDIVANTAAAVRMKSKNKFAVVADIGNINTISAIGRSGEYLGCVIFPGATLALRSLSNEAAQLPTVGFSDTHKVIGKNSHDSICSGVLCSNALAIDGIVKKFIKELGCEQDDIELIATGESAESILKLCSSSFVFEDKLTLKGLYYIYENTMASK